MKAEVFAQRFQKSRLLSPLLGQNVEILDDYGCPKIQDLVKMDSLWICSSYPFRHQNKASLCGEKSKGVGRMGYATFVNFVRVFCFCVYY